jgi:hypothetical protein
MTGWFFAMIYIGGIFAQWDRKIGFWRRLGWPDRLGQKLAEFAWKDRT